jgi:hypothetical protein
LLSLLFSFLMAGRTQNSVYPLGSTFGAPCDGSACLFNFPSCSFTPILFILVSRAAEWRRR